MIDKDINKYSGKNILYVSLGNIFGEKAKTEGVALKIYGQCKALVDNGWNVWLIGYNNNEISVKHINSGEVININKSPKKTMRFKLFEEVNYITESIDFNSVYIRFPYTDIHFILMLKQIRNKVKNIYVEIPTYPPERISINQSLKKFLLTRIDIILGPLLKKYVDEFRIIGEETNFVYGIPAVNINNGIDFTIIPKKNLPDTVGEFTIITVSSMYMAHGYDRLIKGMANYIKKGENNNIKVIMVGDGPLKENWIKLIKQLNLGEYFQFTGVLSNSELEQYFNKAHLAVGSLGLHRIGLKKVSTLKCREYCARGIPFVCTNEEAGFADNFEYKINVPSNESVIEVEELIFEYNKIRKNYPYYIVNMREYAEKNFSWAQQMVLEK